MERFTKLVNGKTCCTYFGWSEECKRVNGYCCECKINDMAWDKLKECEDLEERGLLHIAHISDWSDIYILYRAESDFDEGDCIIKTKYKYGYTEFLFGEFNKGWFLTKEDAERALKIN